MKVKQLFLKSAVLPVTYCGLAIIPAYSTMVTRLTGAEYSVTFEPSTELSREIHHHQIQFVINGDPEWENFKRFAAGI